MTLEKKAFTSYTLDEDKKSPYESGKVITMRLNPEEYRQLKEDMKDLNTKNESTTLKLLAEVGRNVLHSTFGRQKIRWLFNPSRVKQDE